jgi:uncharacterized membrane protein
MLSGKGDNRLLLFLALIFASIICSTMVFARALYGGQMRYAFLVWNLFLAWLPLVLSWSGYVWQKKRLTLLLSGSLWLLFFPNAPYLVTDLIHLRHDGVVPIWFDAIMIFSFALTGLLLGLLSLYIMQTIVTRRFGRQFGWLFAVTALAMSGYGVFVGRFLRWNSWDVFANPLTLLRDILYSLVHPQMIMKTYTVSLLLSAVFMFSYIILLSVPRVVFETHRE